MFERFTEQARHVVGLAQEEARVLRHNYIGTEHILLGLLLAREGLAADALHGDAKVLEHARGVNLLVPKLRLHTQIALNAPLEALGMTDAFGPSANFRGITTAARLQIALVEHAADLRIDEEGTVAAGATAIIAPTAIAQPPGRPVTVTLDRPFLLALRDDASGALLFIAAVANPTSS